MLKFVTILVLASSLGCASPETLGNTSKAQVALTTTTSEAIATKDVVPLMGPREPPRCRNDEPEIKALALAEAEARKKRPVFTEKAGYRVPAELKSKANIIDKSPRAPLPEVKMSEAERLGRIRYEEEYAKLEVKYRGTDRKKLREEAFALKRKLVP